MLVRPTTWLLLIVALGGCSAALPDNPGLADPTRVPRLGPQEAGASVHQAVAVRWRTEGLDAALAEGRESGRAVFAFVSTSWCGPCKRMKEQTFHDPAAVRVMNDLLVPVLLDGEAGDGLALCGKLRINSYPTMVFFGPNGAEIDRAFGYHEGRQLVQVTQDMLRDRNTIADLRRRSGATPAVLGLRQTLGLRLALRGETTEALEFLNGIVRDDPTDAQGQASQALFAIGRYVHMLKTGNHDLALAAYEQLLLSFPKARSAREGTLDLVRIRMMRSQRDEALAALSAMIAAVPEDPQRLLDGAQAVQLHVLDVDTGVGWAERAAKLRGDGLPWFVLGQLQERRGDTAAAEDAYRTAVERSPSDPNLRRALERLRKPVARPTGPAI
mgnify:CR=1 FL=1